MSIDSMFAKKRKEKNIKDNVIDIKKQVKQKVLSRIFLIDFYYGFNPTKDIKVLSIYVTQ